MLDSDQHQTEETRQKFEEALKIYEAYAKQNPNSSRPMSSYSGKLPLNVTSQARLMTTLTLQEWAREGG